jgi:hypothetical protein
MHSYVREPFLISPDTTIAQSPGNQSQPKALSLITCCAFILRSCANPILNCHNTSKVDQCVRHRARLQLKYLYAEQNSSASEIIWPLILSTTIDANSVEN